ncbi:hypothetical protein LTR17_009519 [Elasticomyces elasticus]|nr:hypothetical protein LTR17_009519 [Elasticomyces elasticus]
MTLQVTKTLILTGRDDSLAIALRRNEQPLALLALPAELLCLVANCIPASSFRELRLTCREMAAKNGHAFEAHILQTRWRISEDSLATLLQIARTPRFRHRIRVLRFSVHFLNNYNTWFEKGESAKSYWATLVRQQIEFLEGDRPAALLGLILSNLPDLLEVEIGQWDLGYDNYHGKLDIDRSQVAQYATPTTICFRRILTALALVQPRLVTLSVRNWDIWGIDHGVEVDRIAALEPGTPTARGLGAAFNNMTCFRVCLDYGAKFVTNDWNKGRSQWLTNLIGLMPRLKILFVAFNGIYDDIDRLNHVFESHLDVTRNLFQHAQIPNLVSFELYNAVFS